MVTKETRNGWLAIPVMLVTGNLPTENAEASGSGELKTTRHRSHRRSRIQRHSGSFCGDKHMILARDHPESAGYA